MKLVTFEIHTDIGFVRRLGVIEDGQIIDLNHCYANLLSERGAGRAYSLARAQLPPNMLRFIELGPIALNEAHESINWFKHNIKKSRPAVGLRGEKLVFDFSKVRLLSPLPRPTSLRDFMAFEEHTKAGWAKRKAPVPQEWYEMPVYYKGNTRTIIGPEAEVPWPYYTQKLDYELELAAVIGCKGRNISENNAADYIFGFMIMNDFSARDIQAKEMICRLGPAKGKDFATSMGPWLVTKDEVGDFEKLEMVARINGEEWSRGNSGTRYWSFAKMIEHVSRDEDIYPGDVFGSGTVGGGCGLELDRWIKPGDTVELEITNLGVLRNKIGGQNVSSK